MEQNNELVTNIHEQDSEVLETAKNSTATSLQFNHSVSHTANFDQAISTNSSSSKKSSLTDFIGDLLNLLEQSAALNNKLQAENDELKAMQIKENDLNEELIKDLRAKCEEKDKQLEENANKIKILQAQCDEKEIQLIEKSTFINQLQLECDSDVESNVNKTFRVEYNDKDSLITNLQSANARKDDQLTAMLCRMKSLGKSMHDNQKLLKSLEECVKQCNSQKQYIEGLIHCENAIELEKSSQNRPVELGFFYLWKMFFLKYLKRYEDVIDTSHKSFYYQPNNVQTFQYRAEAYFELGQYSNAREDLIEALQLDPEYEAAQRLLDLVQERITEPK